MSRQWQEQQLPLGVVLLLSLMAVYSLAIWATATGPLPISTLDRANQSGAIAPLFSVPAIGTPTPWPGPPN